MLPKALPDHVSYYEACKVDRTNDLARKEELILQYSSLVKTMALRQKARLPDQISADDLFTAGIIGLMDAIDKFDPSQGISFETYAKIRIRGAMLDEIRAMDWAPRSLRQKGSRLEKTCNALERKLGRYPNDEEIAEAMELSLDDYYKLLNEVKGTSFLPDGVYLIAGENGDSDLHSADFDSSFRHIYRKELKELLVDAIGTLTEREQYVLALYYDEELTMKEIGAVLGCTESRVCQIHSKVIIKLRTRLARKLSRDDLPDDFRSGA